MDIATATPAEIDTRLAQIYAERSGLADDVQRARETIKRIADAAGYERDLPWNSPDKVTAAEQTIETNRERIVVLNTEAAPMEDRFKAERWTRFYWVTNTGGHIHWTTACDTCFPTTSFAWMTEYSGMAHADLVQEAGFTACTVCFPDAPVEVLARKTRMELPERKAAREAREAKKAAADAKAVIVQGYVNWSGSPRAHTFKTERAATNAIASDLGSLCWYGVEHPTAQQWVANIAAIREALTAKGVEYDYDKALAAARKKVTRESSTPRF